MVSAWYHFPTYSGSRSTLIAYAIPHPHYLLLKERKTPIHYVVFLFKISYLELLGHAFVKLIYQPFLTHMISKSIFFVVLLDTASLCAVMDVKLRPLYLDLPRPRVSGTHIGSCCCFNFDLYKFDFLEHFCSKF